jgi:hypothetical protein
MNSFNNANGWADGTYNLAAGGANGINPEQRHQLVVTGNAGDSVVLADAARWVNAGTVSNGGHTYTVYNATARRPDPCRQRHRATLEGIEWLSRIAAGIGGFVINGQCAGDWSGRSVSSAGDVNGDGLADLIVGAMERSGGGQLMPGAATSSSARPAGAPSTSRRSPPAVGGFVINGQCAGDYSGSASRRPATSMATALADLIVGADRSDPAAATPGAATSSSVRPAAAPSTSRRSPPVSAAS